MIILALDTTSNEGSLAIRRDGRIVAQQVLHSADGFAHLIFPAIRDICRQAEVRFAEVDCFAAASGPGSFTGVRVGVSAVKGMAEALGKSALGISNLRALSTFGSSPLRAVAIDAHRGRDLYAAVYSSEGHLVGEECVNEFSDWLASVPASVDEFIFPEPDAHLASALTGRRVVYAPTNLSGAVALCAESDLRAGLPGDPAAVDANYVREFLARKQ
ncbi:MAG: tRNA (adenosine(37)-N6)-threonylcarbamoyltransferase complex dimerization subunit type 1 TsaB [Acidobacteriaceae bacterium]|nr:tRNA (adenosine(37)-N6)-threonylcarbamoyltransferase complex dimerization subunit type 1 TsaB [Acidobacteriaceae bacterium]